ncbi:MAG: alpha/beta fold hydrolase [Gemmataceae bacterium]
MGFFLRWGSRDVTSGRGACPRRESALSWKSSLAYNPSCGFAGVLGRSRPAWRERMGVPPRRPWRRRILVLTAALVAAWLAVSFAVAYRLTRRPRPMAEEPLPQAFAGEAVSVRLTTRDGEELGAWFLPGRPGSPMVVLLHGHGACRGACVEQAQLLREAGCPTLLVTLRGHGDSTGEVIDFGLSARRDVVAAVEWLGERHPGRDVVVWGQSLGSAAALFAAEPLGRGVRGYILECPFADLRTAVWNRLRQRLPAPLDVAAYAGLIAVSPLVLPDLDRIAPREAAAGVPEGTPVLILAGGRDERARPDEARAIAGRVRPEAEVVVFDDGDHVQLSRENPRRYREVVTAYLRRFASTGETRAGVNVWVCVPIFAPMWIWKYLRPSPAVTPPSPPEAT